jgi:acetolactate synthase I/II/III large subunit
VGNELQVEEKTKTISGAEIFLECLKEEGVDTLFGYPGGAVLPIYDALYDEKDITHVLTRHEQAAVHAADGYARVTGKPGVVLVTSGPGATNAVTGIANAYLDSVPLVVITGQVSTQLIGRDSFQEVDIFGITMPITKHNFLVLDVKDLAKVIKSAFYIANSGRKGPVLIDIPKDVMIAKTSFEYPESVEIRGYTPQQPVDAENIERMVSEIKKAQKPVLLIGGGVVSSDAAELVGELARKAQIPVASTIMGLGAFPSRDPLHLGMVGMHGTLAANKAVYQSDLLLCFGVRFSDRVTGKMGTFSPNSIKIQVDIDAAELNKNVGIDYPITGDLKEILTRLVNYLEPGQTAEWIDTTVQWQRKSVRYGSSNSLLKPQDIIQLMDKMTNGDAIVVTDVGQHQIWTAHHYAFSQPRSFLTSAGLGTMGYGLPAAIGGAIAAPGRQVICFSGDGSFQMNLQELMTLSDLQLPVKIVILNNGYLGMVRQWQELFYDRRYSSVKLTSPDYVALAKSFGIEGLRARNLEEAQQVIQTAMSIPGPVLMEFDVTEEENVFPFVPPGKSNHEMILE